ncbi:MAG: CoA transferase [Clostridia bacterium]|nr:CoA transferase [Clostridia bacterium]
MSTTNYEKGAILLGTALQGVVILDLTQKLTGSLATMYLKNFGAEVIKVEMPEGDKARKWEPMREDQSIYFNYLNGGKKSITLDYTTEQGKEILLKLIQKCDVFCIGEDVPNPERYGLDYESLKKEKSDLIYAAYSYFGQEGPMKSKAGSSLVAQARGVAMDMTGIINEEPVQSGPSIAEHYAAGFFASSIVMALVDKHQRGIGQKIDISLQDSIFSCIEAAPAAYSTVGEIHTRKGNFDPSCAPYDTFETSDGFVSVGCATQIQWERFCDVLGFEDLKNDPRFLDNKGRRTDYLFILRPLLAEKMIKMEKSYVENQCRTQGIPCCSVLNIAEITDMPNTIENHFIKEVKSKKFGKLGYPTLPFTLSETPSEIFTDAPALGEHTKEILEQLQISTKNDEKE